MGDSVNAKVRLLSLSLALVFCPWIPAQPVGRETSKHSGKDWKLISLETR